MLARHRGPARAEGEVNDVNDARLCHPGLRINRVLRVMLHTRLSAEAWPQVKAEFTKALALRSRIRRAGWFTRPTFRAGDQPQNPPRLRAWLDSWPGSGEWPWGWRAGATTSSSRA